ncbi:MAG: hypothetical protein DDT21_00958 [Syntrophomonadaceae bacterium]|nr:hypothetical protein [Bacillota bacterium]
MSQDFVLSLARETVLTTLMISAPLLLASLVVGLGISVFQATTQIQEPTLTFVPKIIAILLGVVVFGSWMLNRLLQFAGQTMNRMGAF